MIPVEEPTLLAEVEECIRQLATPTASHPVQLAASHAVHGGKLLRPRLVIAAAGERGDREAVVLTAAAIELLHAALLVHDDVIDDDDDRRGVASVARASREAAAASGITARVAARLGLTTAIVAGDALLVRALAAIARLDVPLEVRVQLVDIIERAMLRAAESEHDDVLLAGREADEGVIQRVLEGKTADYSFRAPLELGAVLGGRSPAAIAALGEIGLRLGVLYQLRDDVLGVFGDEQHTGKSVLSDIRAGTPTLLSALARRDPSWERIASDYGDPAADADAAERVRRVLRESGALASIEQRIGEGSATLRSLIDVAPVDEALRAELRQILERCVERTR
ncbi:polyprenyl synthetase family protein [Agrococcus sp. ProA11]|uniref:polyprenyl synthetase family protein n=1 Tax=Agrococcus chionoecetis TaxID=3153752 RepID=UPI0032614D86